MRKADIDSPSRKKLLAAAQELMLAKGFAATSVDDICRKARLTKGSCFYYFKSKDDLGKAVLEQFCCAAQEKMYACCCQAGESDPLQRVYAHIDFVIDVSKNPAASLGCLLGTFAQELSDTHPKMRALCAAGFQEWAKLIAQDLREAKARHKVKVDFEPHDLAEYFIALIEGSQILARTKQSPKIIQKNMEHLRKYIKSIFGK